MDGHSGCGDGDYLHEVDIQQDNYGGEGVQGDCHMESEFLDDVDSHHNITMDIECEVGVQA